MNNNDILRSLRYTFDIDDFRMIEIFALANVKVNRAEVCDWLKKEGDDSMLELQDASLAAFLSGFIVDKRGKKNGEEPLVEKRLNNNIILRKLKIALNLKEEDMLQILESVEMRISKHELSAFFRHPDQAQYRQCQDQILRNFLHGLQLKFKK